MCAFSLFSGAIAVLMDREAEQRDHKSGRIMLSWKRANRRSVNLSAILGFGIPYWLLTACCFLNYMVVLPFNGNTSQLFRTRYGFSIEEAGAIIAIPYAVVIGLCPVIGIIIDKFGIRGYMLLFGSVAVLTSQVVFAFLPDCEKCSDGIYPLFLVGIGYSMIATSTWSSISLVVRENTIGTALGLATAI